MTEEISNKVNVYTFTTIDGRWYVEISDIKESTASFTAVQFDTLDNKEDMLKNQEFSVVGYVKFDGCMNWLTENGMQHFCGKHHVDSMASMFNEVYDHCKQFFDPLFFGD